MIQVQHLTKSYGSVLALNDVSFHIRQGEFFGLLGPNGAGKTTTISIMSTIVAPDKGSVTIAGHDLVKEPTLCKRNIGVVPQEIALYNELSAYDNLLFWGSLYGVPSAELKKRIDTTLDLFGLFDRRNDKVKTYSGGMKRRINIASALLHQPKVLFMDEPTVGIDPQSRNLIFEVVEKLHKQGMTIVYTTHYMEEAERFCDRIAIIDKGQIIAQGSLEELKSSSKIKECISVTFRELQQESSRKLATLLEGDFNITDGTLSYNTSNVRSDLSKIILKCSEAGTEVAHIDIKKVNLETIFLNLTGKQLRD